SPYERYETMDAALAALERAAGSSRTKVVAGAAGAVLVAGALAAYVGFGRQPSAVSRQPEGVGGNASAGASAGACSSHHACVTAHNGEAWRCRASDHRCVPIASEDCTPMFEPGDLDAEDTVWIGALFPRRGPNAEAFGEMNVAGADFARRELAQATRA